MEAIRTIQGPGVARPGKRRPQPAALRSFTEGWVVDGMNLDWAALPPTPKLIDLTSEEREKSTPRRARSATRQKPARALLPAYLGPVGFKAAPFTREMSTQTQLDDDQLASYAEQGRQLDAVHRESGQRGRELRRARDTTAGLRAQVEQYQWLVEQYREQLEVMQEERQAAVDALLKAEQGRDVQRATEQCSTPAPTRICWTESNRPRSALGKHSSAHEVLQDALQDMSSDDEPLEVFHPPTRPSSPLLPGR